ncbi:MAG: NAD(P)H-quinone dehydrogenase [Actinomycetota bacterium]|nr:NAD(P)H-quinone dehydrogenase [Actinomycetota bacterium]
MSTPSTRIVIIGGGPAGYEAALVAAQLGAAVSLVEREGLGGACVLYDCVPSKTFIATSGSMTSVREAPTLGVRAGEPDEVHIDPAVVHGRVRALALAQSADVRARLAREGVELLSGTARFADAQPGLARHRIRVESPDGDCTDLMADIVLIATGASPRIVPGAEPDGVRVLTWRQVYDLEELPEHLIVVGSGVTGAEFASAYTQLGVRVTLVSSRERVLPGEDADAAAVLEQVFAERGTEIVKGARASSVTRVGDTVEVVLDDGRRLSASHALMTVGSVPNTTDLGLDTVGVELDKSRFIATDRVSRTNIPGVYAAGDCTGVLMLASVAAMQGRIAMWHALGEAVSPLQLKTVSANVFTHPEIATVGLSQHAIEGDSVPARVVTLPFATNARAKMAGVREGFVKLIARHPTGVVVGGVVVAPYASELILPITLAVQNSLTVSHLAQTFSVYPSMGGSITEAGRQLMAHGDPD